MAGIAVEKFSLPISSSSQSQAINGTDKMLIETEQNLPPEIIASLLALVIGLIQVSIKSSELFGTIILRF